ncbi:MAG: hypothetical protein IJ946_04040 [Clostridia bacterium]|nr:hypothetical protein [Clostridia bacterium]
MKKIISVLLCIVLVIGVLPFGVAASEKDELKGYKKHIYEELINCEEKIEFDDFDVSSADVNGFFNDIIWDYPEVGCNVAVNEQGYYEFKVYSYSSGKVAYVEVKYNLNKEQYDAEIKKVEDTIAPILFKVRKMNDFEKALYIHDWICVNFMYDYRLFEGEHHENHDVIGFFSDKMGVCQSYAYTYMYMLRKVGIEAHYVVSDTDAHGWNVVKIDGKWYHVDVTHDDPIIGEVYHYDYLGEVRHTNFLLSDSQIVADGNHDNFYIPMNKDGSIVCGEYEGNTSWREAGSSVLKIGEYWYYLDSSGDAGGLMKTKDFKTAERIMEIGYHYEEADLYGWRIGNNFYGGYFSGLFEYNEHLFFNDETDIYVYDTHHDEFNTLQIDRPKELYYFGMNMSGKTINYITSDSNIKTNVDVDGYYTLGVHIPTDWEVIREATKTEEGEKIKRCYICGDVIERQSIPALGDYKQGDLDGDDEVNTSDLAGMKLYLAGTLKDINVMAADLNADQYVNTSDLATLKLFLAGILDL